MCSKVLIVGASGLVGNALLKAFAPAYTTVGTYHNHPIENLLHLDITKKSDVESIFNCFVPDIVLLPGGMTNVDGCEKEPDLCWKINVEGTKNIAEEARKINAKLVFFSSDYIFDGKNGPYSELDTPNPINIYGQSKLEAEKVVQRLCKNHLIIRTTVIYGREPQGKNFVMSLLRTLQSKNVMKVASDQFGTPTYVGYLADVVKELVECDKSGLYNVAGSKLLNRYEFSRIVAEVFGLDENLIVPVPTSELGQRAKRPLRAGLKIDKIRKEVSTRIVDVEEGLKLMKNEK